MITVDDQLRPLSHLERGKSWFSIPCLVKNQRLVVVKNWKILLLSFANCTKKLRAKLVTDPKRKDTSYKVNNVGDIENLTKKYTLLKLFLIHMGN